MPKLLGRQPIFDREMQVFGYELLFRPTENFDPEVDDDFATAEVLNNALMGVTLPELVGRAKAFINFPTAFFLQENLTPPFGREQMVIEVLERVPPTPQVVNAMTSLKQQGYMLALDDFVFKKTFVPLLQQADIIKLEINEAYEDKLPTLVKKIRNVTSAKLLAEKVETRALHHVCMDLGFDYFQGYFYARPEVLETKEVSVSQLTFMQLLSKIAEPNVQFAELEQIIQQDVGLTVKLLKMASSLGRRSEGFVRILDVLQFFGLPRVKSWVAILAAADLQPSSMEVLRHPLIRAYFMEQFAKAKSLPSPQQFYLAGMLSALDVLLNTPLEECLSGLPIGTQLKEGILYRKGEIGEALSVLEKLEHNEGGALEEACIAYYLRAVKEANALLSPLEGS